MVHGIGAGVARRIDNTNTERANSTPATNISDDLSSSDGERHHHTHLKFHNRNNNNNNSNNSLSSNSDVIDIKMNGNIFNNHDGANDIDEVDELVEYSSSSSSNSDEIVSNDIDVDVDVDIESSSSLLSAAESASTLSAAAAAASSSNLTGTLAVLTLTIVVFVCIFYFSNNLIAFLEMVEKSGLWGNVIFVLSYLPTGLPLAIFSLYIPLTVASGYVYGFVHGFATTMVGSVLSAAFGFWITRKFFVKWLESKIEASPKLSSIRSMVEHHPFKIIILLRILPIPFGLQNSLCAVTRLSFTTFIYSTAIGLVPENSLIVYFGTTTKNLSDISSGGHYQQTLLVVAILVGIVLLIIGKKVLSSPTPLFNTPTITISSSSNIHETTIANQKQIESTRDIILTIKSSTSLSSLNSNNSNNNSINSNSNSASITVKSQTNPPTPFKSRIE